MPNVSTTLLRGFLALSVAVTVAGCTSLQVSPPPEPPALAEENDGARLDWHYRFVDGWQSGTGPLRLQPALAEDVLYAAYQDGQVAALDRRTGRTVWSRQYEGAWQAGITLQAGRLYLLSQSGDLVELDADNGEEMRRFDLGMVSLAPPRIDGSDAVVLGQGGSLGLFDMAEGEWVWVYESEQPSLSLHGQMVPHILEDRVVAGFANGRLAAFDRETGEELWGHRLSNPRGMTDLQRLVDVDADMVIRDGALYTAGYEGRLVEIELATGRIAWETGLSVTASLAATDDRLFVATRDGEIIAFDRSRRAEVWRRQGYTGRPLTGVTLWPGETDRLVVTDRRGFAHVLSAGSGETVGRINFQGHQNFTVPAVAAPDRFYLQSMQGLLVGNRWHDSAETR